jgi:GAF domain-containing protein
LSSNQEHRFSALLLDTSTGPPTLASICLDVAVLLPVNGVSVTLMGPGALQGIASALEGPGKALQDLEFTLGEGPGVDAFTSESFVNIDDLDLTEGRWPLFSSSALELGVRSVCSLPLRSGSATLGVLTLCSELPGVLSGDRLDDALLVADLVGVLVLALQAESISENVASPLDATDLRAVVHQATGMVSAQVGCDMDDALVRLRGQSFASGRPIDQLAEAVVEGNIRFDGP